MITEIISRPRRTKAGVDPYDVEWSFGFNQPKQVALIPWHENREVIEMVIQINPDYIRNLVARHIVGYKQG